MQERFAANVCRNGAYLQARKSVVAERCQRQGTAAQILITEDLLADGLKLPRKQTLSQHGNIDGYTKKRKFSDENLKEIRNLRHSFLIPVLLFSPCLKMPLAAPCFHRGKYPSVLGLFPAVAPIFWPRNAKIPVCRYFLPLNRLSVFRNSPL